MNLEKFFPNRSEYLTYMRNFIFGVEDSLVSTVGLLSGVAIADVSKSTIILTGVVLIFVEAFSMGVGSYISEHATADYETTATSHKTSVIAGIIMLLSYLLSGLVPLLPYLVAPRLVAFWWSIGASLAALFILGAVSAKLLKSKIWNSGLRMLILGGAAIVLGTVVGKLVGH